MQIGMVALNWEIWGSLKTNYNKWMSDLKQNSNLKSFLALNQLSTVVIIY